MENKILKILNQNKNEYVSGQMMSSELNVSRMSISSYIKKLKEKGY
ncbi:MAG: helix-turn-helix domain-containing protein, partial [Coprobacillus sp.]